MTYAQYQQLQAFAKKRITDKLAEIQPRAGNWVSVVGDGIAIEPPRQNEVIPRTDTWVIAVYGRVREQRVGEDWSDWFSWQLLAWAPRNRDQIQSSIGVSDLTFSYTTNEEGEVVFGRKIEVDFQVRVSKTEVFSIATIPVTPFEEAQYRYPIRLILEELDETDQVPTVVNTYELALRQNGQQQVFTPSEPNRVYRILPVAFRRL